MAYGVFAPPGSAPSLMPWDKAEHFTAYFGLALLAGLGWGSMPRHIVEDDLATGRLVRLRPASWDGRNRLPRLPVSVVRRRDRAAGLAGRWLFDRLATVGADEVALTGQRDSAQRSGSAPTPRLWPEDRAFP